MNEPNQWNGPFKGQAVHITDVTFLFKNFDHALSPNTRAVAQAFGDNILAFIYGEEPWPATMNEHRAAMVYGREATTGKIVEDRPGNVGRRATILRYGKTVGYDALLEAVNVFLSGK